MPVTLIILLIFIFLMLVALAIIVRSYKRVEQGKAIVVSGARGSRVSFTGTLVIPFLERYEVLDTTTKSIIIELTGDKGLLTKDNYIFDIKADFDIRINPKRMDILKVAQTVGVEKASSKEEIVKMFAPKFEEALRDAVGKCTFEEVKSDISRLKVAVLSIIPRDLNGFALDDLTINYIPSTIRKINP